jgi:Mg2+-importing ATPase
MSGTAIVAGLTLLLPLAPPIRAAFGFTPMPAVQLGALIAIIASYVGATETAKRRFYRNRP